MRRLSLVIFLLLFLIFCVALTGLFASVTQAETAPCAARDAVVERLAEAYGETRQSIGLAANDTVIEVFASEESGTWTIIATTLTGTTCLLASGRAFENLSETPTPEGDPT